jgi:hypothetical protein
MAVPGGAVGGYIGPLPYEPGPAVPGYLGSFPPGSCVWSDPQYTANGRLVLDAVHRHTDPQSPVVWELRDGWVTGISGGPEADAVAELLVGVDNANRLAECGLGLNPRVEFLPSVSAALDQRATVTAWTRRAGVFFVGMGSDVLQGGKDRSELSPIYGLVKEPTVRAGDTLLIERGRFAIPEAAGLERRSDGTNGEPVVVDRGPLQREAERFFAATASLPASTRLPIASYPLDLRLRTPTETVRLRFLDGKPDPASPPSDYWALELRGEGDVFQEIFSGRRTMGQTLYEGLLHVPEEKAKHNLVVALSWSIRLLQERQQLIS